MRWRGKRPRFHSEAAVRAEPDSGPAWAGTGIPRFPPSVRRSACARSQRKDLVGLRRGPRRDGARNVYRLGCVDDRPWRAARPERCRSGTLGLELKAGRCCHRRRLFRSDLISVNQQGPNVGKGAALCQCCEKQGSCESLPMAAKAGKTTASVRGTSRNVSLYFGKIPIRDLIVAELWLNHGKRARFSPLR